METIYLQHNWYYSQMAAYEAKQDYGFDLGTQIATNACGQLAYRFCTLL